MSLVVQVSSSISHKVSNDRRERASFIKFHLRFCCCCCCCHVNSPSSTYWIQSPRRPLITFSSDWAHVDSSHKAQNKALSDCLFALVIPRHLWLALRGYHTWNEYHCRVKKKTYFRTFTKQDTKSKFFKMKMEFESRWWQAHRRCFPPPFSLPLLVPMKGGKEKFIFASICGAFFLSQCFSPWAFHSRIAKVNEKVCRIKEETLNEFSSINDWK